jgi:hypothetical protein
MSEVQAVVVDGKWIVHLSVRTFSPKCPPAGHPEKSITVIPSRKSWKEIDRMNVWSLRNDTAVAVSKDYGAISCTFEPLIGRFY